MRTKTGTKEKIVAATTGRDRVTDLVKSSALLLVIIGHSLAWNTNSNGEITNTLETLPGLWPITWILQILPLFFYVAGTTLSKLQTTPPTAGGATGAAAPPAAVTPAAPAGAYAKRYVRLAGPAITLYLIATIGVWLVGLYSTDAAKAAGIITIQLTWFLGVYLGIIAAANWLSKLHTKGILAMVAVIIAADLARIHLAAAAGWANMFFVWALFAALGANHKHILAASKTLRAAAAIGLLGAAAALVTYGPYSVSLITVPALPGLSNLSPPSAVLACVGTAQILILGLLWTPLQKLISNNTAWMIVAIFASRAMGIYIYHMTILTLAVGATIAADIHPDAASPAWWALHIIVGAVTLTAAFWIAGPAGKLTDRLTAATAKTTRWAKTENHGTKTIKTLLSISAISILLLSSTGVNQPLTIHKTLGLPIIPAVIIAWLLLVLGLTANTTKAGESTNENSHQKDPPS